MFHISADTVSFINSANPTKNTSCVNQPLGQKEKTSCTKKTTDLIL